MGGDVYTGPSFAIDAIAAGHEAAVSIHRFVQPGSTLTIGRNQRRYTALDRDDVVLESYDNASREVAHVDREREKAAPFSEYVETFTEEQVRAETARCWAAAPRSSTPTSVSAAACAPPSARLTLSIWIATAPSAPRWSNTSKSFRARASML